MARIPDPQAHRKQWAKLDWRTRRRIVRSVNRGRALEDRKEAGLAVGVAQGQQRFWRWAWLLGPLAALFVLDEGVGVYLGNAGLATSILGLMSWFWYRRAQRAEGLNRDVALGRSKRRHTPD